MNPFAVLDRARADYRAYVESFQRFRNPRFADQAKEHIKHGHMLLKESLFQTGQRDLPGPQSERDRQVRRIPHEKAGAGGVG